MTCDVFKTLHAALYAACSPVCCVLCAVCARGAGSVPYKLPVRVLEAAPAVARDDGSTNRHVVVEGGVNVLAPGHVKAGDMIVVRTHDNAYMSMHRE